MVDEVEKLKAAIRWIVENDAHYGQYYGNWSDGGCGCCSDSLEPPPDVAETLAPLLPPPQRKSA